MQRKSLPIRSFALLLICSFALLLPACSTPKTVVIVVTATPEVVATPTLLPPTSTPIPPPLPSPSIPLPTIAQLSATAVPIFLDTPTPTSLPYILWDEAAAHIGEETTVCGPVLDSHYAETSNGKPTFLNIGAKYPDPERFTVVIWESDRDKFPGDPAQIYLDLNICVTGKIEEYNGSIEIVVEDPAQIVIDEEK